MTIEYENILLSYLRYYTNNAPISFEYAHYLYIFQSYILGLVKDECSLRDLKVSTGAKMMVIGSTIDDIITAQAPSASLSDSDPPSFHSGTYHFDTYIALGRVVVFLFKVSEVSC